MGDQMPVKLLHIRISKTLAISQHKDRRYSKCGVGRVLPAMRHRAPSLNCIARGITCPSRRIFGVSSTLQCAAFDVPISAVPVRRSSFGLILLSRMNGMHFAFVQWPDIDSAFLMVRKIDYWFKHNTSLLRGIMPLAMIFITIALDFAVVQLG